MKVDPFELPPEYTIHGPTVFPNGPEEFSPPGAALITDAVSAHLFDAKQDLERAGKNGEQINALRAIANALIALVEQGKNK